MKLTFLIISVIDINLMTFRRSLIFIYFKIIMKMSYDILFLAVKK